LVQEPHVRFAESHETQQPNNGFLKLEPRREIHGQVMKAIYFFLNDNKRSVSFHLRASRATEDKLPSTLGQ